MENHRTGIVIGILTFLGGITLLVITFTLAYNIFQTPIEQLLGLNKSATIDTSQIGGVALKVVIELLLKSLMLIIMSIIAGFITHRGIRLFWAARKPLE